MRIEKVLVLPNPEKQAALDCCEKIVSDLRSWGCSADYIPIGEGLHDKITACSPELMVVLGGDGSIIDVARCSAGMDIPIVGVNFGTVGYMAEINHDSPQELKKIIEGRYHIQKRMMLDVTIIRSDGRAVSSKYPALNDAVLSNGPIPKLLEFELYANGRLAHYMRSDGVIISTPTGSSAYSMSAGGPVMDPELSCICSTPICPHHLNNNRPTIFRGRTVLEIRNAKCRDNNIYMSVDGREVFDIGEGDIVRISRSAYTTPLVRISNDSFLRLLNTKLSYRPIDS
mgnify:FL=1